MQTAPLFIVGQKIITMHEFNLRLLADRIAVTIDKPDEVTKGGIIIPDALRGDEKPTLGTVVSVSKQVTEDAQEHEKIEEGDRVLFSQFAGADVEFEDKEYKILRITDVIAVVIKK